MRVGHLARISKTIEGSGGCAADGKTPKDTRTEAQRAALIKLVGELKASYPSATVHGHNEFANKACPSFNVQKESELCGR